METFHPIYLIYMAQMYYCLRWHKPIIVGLSSFLVANGVEPGMPAIFSNNRQRITTVILRYVNIYE